MEYPLRVGILGSVPVCPVSFPVLSVVPLAVAITFVPLSLQLDSSGPSKLLCLSVLPLLILPVILPPVFLAESGPVCLPRLNHLVCLRVALVHLRMHTGIPSSRIGYTDAIYPRRRRRGLLAFSVTLCLPGPRNTGPVRILFILTAFVLEGTLVSVAPLTIISLLLTIT